MIRQTLVLIHIRGGRPSIDASTGPFEPVRVWINQSIKTASGHRCRESHSLLSMTEKVYFTYMEEKDYPHYSFTAYQRLKRYLPVCQLSKEHIGLDVKIKKRRENL